MCCNCVSVGRRGGAGIRGEHAARPALPCRPRYVEADVPLELILDPILGRLGGVANDEDPPASPPPPPGVEGDKTSLLCSLLPDAVLTAVVLRLWKVEKRRIIVSFVDMEDRLGDGPTGEGGCTSASSPLSVLDVDSASSPPSFLGVGDMPNVEVAVRDALLSAAFTVVLP